MNRVLKDILTLVGACFLVVSIVVGAMVAVAKAAPPPQPKCYEVDIVLSGFTSKITGYDGAAKINGVICEKLK